MQTMTTEDAARTIARHRPAPRNAEYARGVIREMKEGQRNVERRKRTVGLILRRGNYTADGLAVFRAWLADGCE